MPQTAKRAISLVAIATVLTSCSSSSSGPGNGGGNTTLTVSAATPSNGNGALTIEGMDTVTSPFATNGDKIFLALRATSAGKEHEFWFYIDPDDGDIPLVEHRWATDLDVFPTADDGNTVCSNTGAFPACDPAQFAADVAQGTITLTGLVLGSALGDGDASTVTGTISY